MKTTGIIFVLFILTGCASSSKEIQATYVSPMTYTSYDCQQLSREADRVSSRVSELTGQIDERASGDKTTMAVALVLFWPAAFFLGNNEAQNAELSKLKGESEALQQASIEKKCESQVIVATSSQKSIDSSDDVYMKIEKLAKLKDEGVLTDEEFQAEKTKLLSGSNEETH